MQSLTLQSDVPTSFGFAEVPLLGRLLPGTQSLLQADPKLIYL